MEQTLLAHTGRRARARRALPRALRPGGARGAARAAVARADRAGDRRRRLARRGPHPARLPERRARRCCARTTSCRARSRTCRSSSTRTRIPLTAAAAAAVRDLRALAAGRGRAPARRLGRARRPALVRPARGLPHRDPRADEGADGQERADRAGRRQGRLRGQAPPATESSPIYTTFISALLDITDNDRGRRDRAARATSCATTATTPTWSSRPTRARRRSRDIANGVAESYGFWLGDAFASGGSVGYDHKAMGITARSRVGVGPAPLPRARRRRPDARTSPSPASAT